MVYSSSSSAKSLWPEIALFWKESEFLPQLKINVFRGQSRQAGGRGMARRPAEGLEGNREQSSLRLGGPCLMKTKAEGFLSI